MKKIALLSLLAAGILSAQSFTFNPEDTYIEADSGFVQFNCTLENLTGRNLGLRAIRMSADMPENWISSLCVGISCYPPETDTADFVIPGNGSTHFSLDVIISGDNPGTGHFLIRIENSSDTSEAVLQEFIATNNPSGLSPLSQAASFILLPAYPNPFNPSVTLDFQIIDFNEAITLSIWNLKGLLVWQETQYSLQPGHYSFRWSGNNLDGHSLSSGIYLCRIHSAGYEKSQKITLLK